jgi:hypothetical protein
MLGLALAEETPYRMIVKLLRAVTAGAVRLSMKGLPRGPHITRFFMYRHLAQFRQSPNLHKLAIRNDPDWPIVTWVVAQK